MSSKSLVWIGLFVGSTIGGLIPALWGDNFLSVWSIILSTVGGIAGIWAGFQMSKMI